MNRLCGLLLAATALLSAQKLSDLKTAVPVAPGETIVLGFLGSLESYHDERRSVRKLAHRLNERPGVHAETFANRNRKTARRFVERALDQNRDGKLDSAERNSARVVIYGQSLGGAATVRLARDLAKRRIPVLLTVQVDSVGLRDAEIPANVRAAANFYQHERFTIRGEEEIHAADPARTRIVGNFRHHYPLLAPYPPMESKIRALGGGHARMEADPLVWLEVETLITAAASR